MEEAIINKRRTLRRKPLSDCTNTVATRSSTKSLLNKPSTKFLVPPPKPTFQIPDNTQKKNKITPTTQSDTSVGSNPDNNNNNGNGLCPSSVPSLPSTPLRLPDYSPSTTWGEPMTEYTRRHAVQKRKDKGKMVVDPLSCPPAERIRNFRDEPRDVGGIGLSKTCKVPRKKKQRQLPPEKDKHALPQDYIEQQRAYFAEIDAFELPEEVVSESELE